MRWLITAFYLAAKLVQLGLLAVLIAAVVGRVHLSDKALALIFCAMIVLLFTSIPYTLYVARSGKKGIR